MWGLISMFDFRHGRSTRKLIADRRHGSKHTLGTGISKNKFEVLSNLEENCQGTIDGNEIKREIVTADAGKPSVKKLMEEEMVNEQGLKKDMRDAVVEPRQSESAHEGQIKTDHKKTKKNRKKSRDLDAHNLNVDENLKSECSCKQNADQQSVKDLGIDEIMEEFSRRIHQKSISCMDGLNGEAIELSSLKNSDSEEKLKRVIKEFIVQKFTNGKHLKEDQKIQHYKELMNELELISSDEELFLKVVQDPQSLLVKHVQNLQDSKAEKDEESKLVGGSDFSEQKLVTVRKSQDAVNHKQRSFFRRKAKSEERNQLKENEHADNLNRIVILKPGPMGVQNSKIETSLGPSKESHDIVTNKEASDKVGSHFFLSELKRKLKHAMGKQHNEISRVRVSNRPTHKGQTQGDGEKGVGKGSIGRNSPTKDHFFFERIAKPSSGSKKADKINKMRDSEISKHETDDLSNERISNIYIEAKKHLSELLSNGDGMGLSNRQNPKTLGRILSLPDYSISPIGSPGRDWEKSFVTAQTRFTSQDKFQNVNEKRSSPRGENKGSPLGRVVKTVESQSPITDISPDHKVQDPNSNTDISEDNACDVEVEDAVCSTKDGMSREGDLKLGIEDSINLDSPHENSASYSEPVKDESMILDLPCEASVSSTARDNQTDGDVPVLCEDERNFVCLKQDSHEKNQLQSSPPGSPSSSLTTSKVADLEISIDIPERPSPVSVLEPVFGEDDISPSKTKSQPVNITVQPLRIKFEEPASPLADEARSGKRSMDNKDSIFGYVKAVMQASGLNWYEVCIKLLSSDQLLDPSLVDEVEFFSNPLCCDQKLLFDCINEVLVEVCQYHFGCSPWVSFAKPGIHLIPDMKSVILEVSKGVYWHLLQLPLPHTLDQIVRKDMERSGTWLDVRFDAEAIGFDMGETILEDLMEDTILSYVNESSESEHGVLSESNKSEGSVNS
ncbi:hypothetical protein L484_017272 [Morus notabilis]|uniref:DUF4378 domain-containing protein n=1 Tax=Morus notabilis TaxID=981085 RepID=W9RSW1_9ROSA|nr:hypothetical protein L484_017272 [Morus notabilis]